MVKDADPNVFSGTENPVRTGVACVTVKVVLVVADE